VYGINFSLFSLLFPTRCSHPPWSFFPSIAEFFLHFLSVNITACPTVNNRAHIFPGFSKFIQASFLISVQLVKVCLLSLASPACALFAMLPPFFFPYVARPPFFFFTPSFPNPPLPPIVGFLPCLPCMLALPGTVFAFPPPPHGFAGGCPTRRPKELSFCGRASPLQNPVSPRARADFCCAFSVLSTVYAGIRFTRCSFPPIQSRNPGCSVSDGSSVSDRSPLLFFFSPWWRPFSPPFCT